MTCTEPRELLHAYLDRELDLVNSLEMEEHLRRCGVCASAYDAERALRARFTAEDLRFDAPAGLVAKLRVKLDRERRGEARRGSWWMLAAPLAVAALLVIVWLPGLRSAGAPDALVDEIVSSHVRSLMADHLADVRSSDRHTVKPWFDGKLDFSPPVVDLADHGFPLVGGRLDYLAGRPAAALVYARQRHFINLFVWPAKEAAAGDRTLARNGYQLLHWQDGAMTYWAVSDLNAAELAEFAGLLRERGAAPR